MTCTVVELDTYFVQWRSLHLWGAEGTEWGRVWVRLRGVHWWFWGEDQGCPSDQRQHKSLTQDLLVCPVLGMGQMS